MILYHGTTSHAFEAIRHQGLIPRGAAPGNFAATCPSHPGSVYLTSVYPLYFAAGIARGRPGVVIEVETDDLDEANLHADEDHAEQVGRERDGLPLSWSLARRCAHYRDDPARRPASWRDSLRDLGTCAHLGPIPVRAFRRAAIVDFSSMPSLELAALDMSVSVLNFRFCAADHRHILAWVLGDPPPPPDPDALAFHDMPGYPAPYRRSGRGGIMILDLGQTRKRDPKVPDPRD